MRKNLTIFCVLALSLLWVGAAFALNASTSFKIDSNIATMGYQETTPALVTGIGSTKQVGFAVYTQACENIKGFTIKFEWDSTKATFRKPPSDVSIIDNDITVNGVSIIPSVETNTLGQSLVSAGESNVDGFYTISLAGDTSTAPVGLLYFAVFRTTDTFKTTDMLYIKVSVIIADSDGNKTDLGYHYFYVNSVAVKNSTWGDVKNQFKDF